jgi:hypothetical protein
VSILVLTEEEEEEEEVREVWTALTGRKKLYVIAVCCEFEHGGPDDLYLTACLQDSQ